MEQSDVTVDRLLLDGNPLYRAEVFCHVPDAHGRTKVVYDVCLNTVEDRALVDPRSLPHVLFEDLLDDTLDVGALLCHAVKEDCPGEPAFEDVAVKLFLPVRAYRLPKELLHAFVLIEGECEDLKLKIATGELGCKLTRK